jgi:mRNA-degrading endonuclease RelE of RelBE toxin-antitoxin system
MYQVVIKKKTLKAIQRLPLAVQQRLVNLVEDLRDQGPIQKGWPNFSKLGADHYHCHLSYHWVVCWKHQSPSLLIEVYYAGSRENAPY